MVKVKEEEKGLSVISGNADLLKKYQENAVVGAENLGGVSPLLKVHSAGRSTSNILADGGEPDDGAFFYQPTAEQFKEVECHILTISKGFRADGIDKKNVFNQIMAGVVVNGGVAKAFLMYMTGVKLSPMWDFGKEASKYTRAKPFGIPMFALRVKLTTEKKVVEYKPGKKTNVWLIKFEIMKNEDGSPVLVTDPKAFDYLRASVTMVKETIDKIIESKAPEETVESTVVEALPTEQELKENKEPVNPDEIPF